MIAPGLQQAIETAHAHGRLGVTFVEIERRLAMCRGCEQFTQTGCRNCTCSQGQEAWMAGLIFDVTAYKRWVCPKWAA